MFLKKNSEGSEEHPKLGW